MSSVHGRDIRHVRGSSHIWRIMAQECRGLGPLVSTSKALDLAIDRILDDIEFRQDQVEFQNGFGAAVNMIYECDIDPAAEVVLAVRVFEGRL